MEAFVRDGYVVIRGAFDANIAAACRALTWDSMAGQGIREDDPATWPPLAEPGGLAGEPFTAAGSSPVLAGVCDELIGPGRWTSSIACGGAEMACACRAFTCHGLATFDRARWGSMIICRRSMSIDYDR